jgi:hypothetical protein
MNSIVHGHKEQATRSLGDIRMPAIQQNRNMVIPVQENKGLFMNDNEKGINKFTAVKSSQANSAATTTRKSA